MSDTATAQQEFDLLEVKRKQGTLTPAEGQRWFQLGSTLGLTNPYPAPPAPPPPPAPGYYAEDGNWYPYPDGVVPPGYPVFPPPGYPPSYFAYPQAYGGYPPPGYPPYGYYPPHPGYAPPYEPQDPNAPPPSYAPQGYAQHPGFAPPGYPPSPYAPPGYAGYPAPPLPSVVAAVPQSPPAPLPLPPENETLSLSGDDIEIPALTESQPEDTTAELAVPLTLSSTMPRSPRDAELDFSELGEPSAPSPPPSAAAELPTAEVSPFTPLDEPGLEMPHVELSDAPTFSPLEAAPFPLADLGGGEPSAPATVEEQTVSLLAHEPVPLADESPSPDVEAEAGAGAGAPFDGEEDVTQPFGASAVALLPPEDSGAVMQLLTEDVLDEQPRVPTGAPINGSDAGGFPTELPPGPIQDVYGDDPAALDGHAGDAPPLESAGGFMGFEGASLPADPPAEAQAPAPDVENSSLAAISQSSDDFFADSTNTMDGPPEDAGPLLELASAAEFIPMATAADTGHAPEAGFEAMPELTSAAEFIPMASAEMTSHAPEAGFEAMPELTSAAEFIPMASATSQASVGSFESMPELTSAAEFTPMPSAPPVPTAEDFFADSPAPPRASSRTPSPNGGRAIPASNPSPISMDDEPVTAIESVASPGSFVQGEHRVIIHTLEGQVKRGTIRDLNLTQAIIPLEQSGAGAEPISSNRVKAIFFMTAAGGKPPPALGQKIRVTFTDGRQVAGFSADFSGEDPGFFVVPADNRTNTARIYIFRASVQTVAAG